jgi:hypothetical protein
MYINSDCICSRCHFRTAEWAVCTATDSQVLWFGTGMLVGMCVTLVRDSIWTSLECLQTWYHEQTSSCLSLSRSPQAAILQHTAVTLLLSPKLPCHDKRLPADAQHTWAHSRRTTALSGAGTESCARLPPLWRHPWLRLHRPAAQQRQPTPQRCSPQPPRLTLRLHQGEDVACTTENLQLDISGDAFATLARLGCADMSLQPVVRPPQTHCRLR